VEDISLEAFLHRRSSFTNVLIDVGTGDGRFVYHHAGAHPDVLAIGIDAVREQMREVSAKASRKSARGGLRNCMFIEAAVESLPVELTGIADQLTVNYPWGSLLAAFLLPNTAILQGIVRLAKPGATLNVLLNYSVFEDKSYMERLNLPHFDETDLTARVRPLLREIGIEITSNSVYCGQPPQWTSWGKRLVAGSSRKTMAIQASVRLRGCELVLNSSDP